MNLSFSLRLLLYPLGVAALVLACGEEETDDGSAAAREAFTKDFCEIVAPCCGSVLALAPDAAACHKRVQELDPAAIGDEKARADCLAQLRRVAALPEFCAEFGNLEQPACPDARRKLTAGAKKPGEPCAADAECAPSFEGPVACKTVCQLTKRGKEGDGPCAATVEGDVDKPLDKAPAGASAFVCFLRDGLHCDPDTTKCERPREIGADCTTHDSCVRASFCDETTKRCVTRKGSGSSCTEDAECPTTAHCDAGFCSADTADDGAACERNEVCKTEVLFERQVRKATSRRSTRRRVRRRRQAAVT